MAKLLPRERERGKGEGKNRVADVTQAMQILRSLHEEN